MKGAAPTPLRPRLCFVGPMVGRNPGYVITQGVRLSEHFRRAGYQAIAVSASPNRYVRLLEIASTIIRKRDGIDILIIHVYGGPSFVVEDIASTLGRRFSQRIVMLLHGGAMPDFMASFPRWTRRVLSRAGAIVAPSDFLARAVAPRGFSCRVIPNVIDVGEYPFRHRRHLKPRLLWIRTFHPIYNPAMAVRVLARLRAAYPQAVLVMAGEEKGAQTEIKGIARELGVGDAVSFPGFLDMPGKVREGRTCDIFLNTSHVDNMPVTIVEACAMGLPVVSTDVGGIRDLLADDETGLLVPDGGEEAMAEAIDRLLRDPDLAGRLSANGRSLAERSDWAQVRPQWEEVFESLLSSPARRVREGS